MWVMRMVFRCLGLVLNCRASCGVPWIAEFFYKDSDDFQECFVSFCSFVLIFEILVCNVLVGCDCRTTGLKEI